MGVEQESFGEYEGKDVLLYTLANPGGIVVRITNYACAITEIHVPDRDGRMGDVVLGYETLEGYLGDAAHLGAVVGRYGNRIAEGCFEIEGNAYTLATNNGENHLHGGIKGFDRKAWDSEQTDDGVRFSLTSPDGDEGYPGTLDATVDYLLTDDKTLRVDYRATTDAPTHVNLTNHSYFNLACGGDVLRHEVTLRASRYTPVDEGLIPTGELRSVDGTPFEFGPRSRIGERIDDPEPQIQMGGGYDHNFVLDREGEGLETIATVVDPDSGRKLEVQTTEPGVQFYTGNFLDGSIVGKGGVRYQCRSGFCLETQHFPDSPNKPEFPSTLLKPGEIYETTTVFRFTTASGLSERHE
ncbi:MAG: aldose epimerase family protein [Candidatus Latescibacterota bacterium]|nr:aldose epimerase family protein [Candidatus Latescibacterota bacterium]